MRWKLLIITSLLAAIVSAGASLGIAYGLLGSFERLTSSTYLSLAAVLIPFAAITYASIFVYRHTARRRSLQAMTTALLSIVLTLSTILVWTILAAPARRTEPDTLPHPTPQTNAA